MPKPKPTYARVKELLDYSPETGVLTWKVDRRLAKAGDVAGVENNGYLYVTIENQFIGAHRLAWLLATGWWASQTIDHIDGDRQNNRLSNLRDVSRQVNTWNQRKAKSGNSNGLLGVSKSDGAYVASIWVDRKYKKLGRFKTPEEAHRAYIKAKKELHGIDLEDHK